jgi:hypothetical protein
MNQTHKLILESSAFYSQVPECHTYSFTSSIVVESQNGFVEHQFFSFLLFNRQFGGFVKFFKDIVSFVNMLTTHKKGSKYFWSFLSFANFYFVFGFADF